ncbi:Uncharacterized protein SCF082_LOCUS7699 [Durusdinium trenchii]|uniref:Sulfotransferase n=1 Tax=Durusdinium trenchii TaxID=1381693 RepID=A0ABP0IL72_9DINO
MGKLRQIHWKLLSLILLAASTCLYLHRLLADEAGTAGSGSARCEWERWSCELQNSSCADLSWSDCASCNGSWLGLALPKTWLRKSPPLSNCFVTGDDEMRCLPTLLNLAPPKSGTTEIYQQIQTMPEVISAAPAEPSSLCRGRSAFWCSKEPSFWHAPRSAASLQEYTLMYQPLTEKLQGGSGSSTIAVDWSPLNYEANPYLLGRFVGPAARFVAFLRNPVQRAESDYNWSIYTVGLSCTASKKKIQSPGSSSGSSQAMHKLFASSVKDFTTCAATSSPLRCWRRGAPARELNCRTFRESSAYVLRGLYSVYLSSFLEVFPGQLLVARAESLTWPRLAALLGATLAPRPTTATLAPFRGKHQVHLLPETQQLLKSFYAPYVLELQHMFNDSTLSWW